MEKQREQARSLGYQESYNCGPLDLHIFGSADLERNLPVNDSAISLAAVESFGDMPCLHQSHLDILPGTEDRPMMLSGRIDFSIPGEWRQLTMLNQKVREFGNKYLPQQVNHIDTKCRGGDDFVSLETPRGGDMYVTLQRRDQESGWAEITLTLNDQVPSECYHDILYGTTIWGELHNFIAQGNSKIPYRGDFQIYVGRPREFTISDIELTVGTRLGQLASRQPDLTLPGWSDDISGEDLTKIELLSLPGSDELERVAEFVINEKFKFYSLGYEMGSISQGDIVSAMAKSFRQQPKP